MAKKSELFSLPGIKEEVKGKDKSLEVSELVDFLITQAIKHNASDVHFLPLDGRLSVRYRIDGVLQDIVDLSLRVHPRVIASIKVIAKQVVYLKDRPQDGHIEKDVEGKSVELRVATFPTVHGEKAVVRIFDSTEALLDLDKLGFEASIKQRFQSLILQPQGTIILTGPSSSGKTTTIYAALRRILDVRKNAVNIVTLEDPVEYNLGNVSQTQISLPTGLTFVVGLKSILRQDPEVIMIGEVRDVETANIAVQAGLTGHLVITTIHSGTAPGVFARLMNMGIEPFLIASSISGVLAQRLVRLVCPYCREPYKPQESIIKNLKIKNPGEYSFTRGKGCSRCDQTGYRGRTAITELLVVDDKMRDTILKRSATGQLAKQALKSGMKTLKQDGLGKVSRGITTLEEISRVSVSEARW